MQALGKDVGLSLENGLSGVVNSAMTSDTSDVCCFSDKSADKTDSFYAKLLIGRFEAEAAVYTISRLTLVKDGSQQEGS